MIVSRFLISKAGAGKDAYSCFLQQLKGVKNVGQLIERLGFGHCFVWQLNLGWIVCSVIFCIEMNQVGSFFTCGKPKTAPRIGTHLMPGIEFRA